MHDRRHLRRLPCIWLPKPVYFITLCTARRREFLHCSPVGDILARTLAEASVVHGWAVGRYVIMPDHLHFFCAALSDTKSLSEFMRDWKRWSTRCIVEATGVAPPVWQTEFFDHVLRSRKSYDAKWLYVRENPVRVGLVTTLDGWPHQGDCVPLAF